MKLKFMGSSDVKELRKGDTFGGTLSEGLPVDVSWDASNNWVVDTSDEKYADVSDEAWEYLIVNDNFADVTDFVRVPLNDHQKMFLGLREGEQKTLAEEEEERQRKLDEAFQNARDAAAAANAREEVLQKIRNSEASREELMEFAKEQNIKGRSKMSKEELQEALTDAYRSSAGVGTPLVTTTSTATGTVGAGTTTAGGSTTGGSTSKGGSST